MTAENESNTYFPSPEGVKARLAAEEESKEYILSRTPEKYWQFIVPNFPLGIPPPPNPRLHCGYTKEMAKMNMAIGCKRRIFDPGYLDSLHRCSVSLRNEGIQEFTANGIISSSGVEDEFDMIVLATGFQVTQFLAPMEIKGKRGIPLNQQWEESRGAQAYFGTYVHNFPNLAIMYVKATAPSS